jgi:hypothetical protein
MIDAELKSCPCGCAARLVFQRGESYGIHNGEKYTKVECSSCSFSADDTDDWNTRATQNNSIRVDDALPELKLRVMAFDAGGFGWVSARFTTNGWYLEGDLDTHCHVTHWMPLPTPPIKKDI